jgi:hypothetical protein
MGFLKSMIEMVKTITLSPVQTARDAVYVNVQLWTKTFWETWEPLPLDTKLAWIAFVFQTVAIITLIELFALKK